MLTILIIKLDAVVESSRPVPHLIWKLDRRSLNDDFLFISIDLVMGNLVETHCNLMIRGHHVTQLTHFGIDKSRIRIVGILTKARHFCVILLLQFPYRLSFGVEAVIFLFCG